MARLVVRRLPLTALAAAILVVLAFPASAQSGESIHRFDVRIQIRDDGSLTVTETIAYDFGSAAHHGIVRSIPTRTLYDETYDRVYPLTVTSVSATDASADYDVSEQGPDTVIKIGDPDRTVTGAHTYTITYSVLGVLNSFSDHDELYWNALGDQTQVPVERARVEVKAPAKILRVRCFLGYVPSTDGCGQAGASGDSAEFAAGRTVYPYEAFTVVLAVPKGAVPEPHPILAERWSFGRAFTPDGVPGIVAVGTFLVALAGLVGLGWRLGRDRRYAGSQVDQVMGSPGGQDQPVPVGDADAEAPVEFAPPEGLRPGLLGTLIDERANVLDVTATIVDLAVRGFLVIHEIPKKGLFGKPDWRLVKLEHDDGELQPYERLVLTGLFKDGDEVQISALRATFAARLHQVEDSLYAEVVDRGWFRHRPDKTRARWRGWGVLTLLVGIAMIYVLARWTHFGLTGAAVVLAGVGVLILAGRIPARTAKGTAMLRRARGFRRVIETAEVHMSRWAEKENVFTQMLPFAVVFGLTDKWAKAFAALGIEPDTSTWYVGARPLVWGELTDSLDAFAVTAGGTLASTPAGSGSSGFSGGGFSGGGAGGGGVGSW